MRASAIDTSKWITVYHGHQDPVTRDHSGKFFSTDRDFAREYGSVSTYQIRLSNLLDTTDKWVAENVIVPLKIEDPYDGSLVTYDYWEKFNSDTWEMVEYSLDSIISKYTTLTGKSVDTILVTEGGVTNYIVLNTANMKKIAEPTREEITETANDADIISDLRQKYSEYNTLYFDGQLPDIPIRWGKLKVAGAAVSFNVRGKAYGEKQLVPNSVEMVFSSKYKRTAEQLYPLLLHEMIHVYLVTVLGDVHEHHGVKFMRELARVSEQSGIDIPLTDSTKDLELSEPIKSIGVLIRHIAGKIAYALFSEKTTMAKIDEIKKYYTRGRIPEDIEVRIAKSEIWTRKSAGIPLQRNIGYKTRFWIASKEDYDDLVKNSKLVWSSTLSEDAYHGTANEFDQFDGAYVGTGDGALTFGWGIYLASNRDVAKEFAQGVILKVQSPNEEKLLHWNDLYADQSNEVKAALERMNIRKIIKILIDKEYISEQRLEDLSGEEIYSVVAAVPFRVNQSYDKYVKYKKRASQWLYKNGIDGIKYKDVVIGGSYNYVIFDPASIKIIEREYIEPQEEEVYDEYSDYEDYR